MPLKPLRINAFTPKTVELKKHDFFYQYGTESIKYSVWSTNHSSRIKTIVFLGTVQIGKLPLWIAQNCPLDTVVVQGAPHWLARDDGGDIPEFMSRFTEEAFISILKTYRTDKLCIIAESQAVPGVLRLLTIDSYSIRVNKLALLQPLGLNATAFAGTTKERTDIFKRRIARNFRYQLTSLLFDRRLRYNHKQLLRTVGYDNAKSNAQYGSGLLYDATDDLKKIYATHGHIVVVCGEKDMLFPPQELQAMMTNNKLDIPIIIVPRTPHSPPATRQGMRLLNKAFEYFEMDQ
jgi:hypothetical protein